MPPRRRRLRKIKDIQAAAAAVNDKQCQDSDIVLGDDGFALDSIPIEPESPHSAEESPDQKEKEDIAEFVAPDDPTSEECLSLLRGVLRGTLQLSDFSNIPTLVPQPIEQDHAKSRKRRSAR